MNTMWLCVLLLLTLSLLLSADGQESCRFYYLTQPPSKLPCNPYLDTSRFSVRIECMVAVDQGIGGNESDFRIRWFAQSGSDSTPEELLLNDDSSFSVRIDQPTISSLGFFVYQSQVRISDLEIDEFDRFWCEIGVSDVIRDSANITSIDRSDETIIADISTYTSPVLPSCPPQAFFHQASLKCADFPNDTIIDVIQSEPSSTSSSMLIPSTILPSPSSCPPVNAAREGSTQTSRLVSVLLPSLIIPVIVAILLVIAAVIMTCNRSRKPERNQYGRKVNAYGATSAESPIITILPTTIQATETEAASKDTDTAKVPPPRPPPPIIRLPVNNTDRISSPVPPVPTRLAPTTERQSNRFSQDIYEDIADSALESYSMSNYDTYSAKMDAGGAGVEGYPDIDRPLRLNGANYHSKTPKKDESSIAHYKNAALIAISERAAPTLLPKKAASSLPSLLDPKHYNDSTSPRRRPYEAPGAVGVAYNEDHYDTLAKRKKVPTYCNQTGSCASLALRMEDDDPDYDEVDDDEEEDSFSDAHHGGKYGSKLSAANATAKGKYTSPRRNQNYVVSESYEDMSGMEDLIESLKSSTTVTAL